MEDLLIIVLLKKLTSSDLFADGISDIVYERGACLSENTFVHEVLTVVVENVISAGADLGCRVFDGFFRGASL